MNLAELKLKIVQKIIETDDLNLLLKIESFLNDSTSNEIKESASIYKKTEDVYAFNDWQEEKVKKALQQFDNGEFISDEEAQTEIQSWIED